MELRTRILPKMLNGEVQEYLKQNDIIIVPVGTVEMHGGLPLDVETNISEAVGLKMAEACDGLLLTGLQYFYAGATASGRGTVQVSVRQGIDYLGAVARSLLRQGFKRQVYLSLHGPAHMTVGPMVRDFYDETGVPILYLDMTMQMFGQAKDLFQADSLGKDPKAFMKLLDSMFVGAYQIMGRLGDVPLTTEYDVAIGQSCAPFNDILNLAYQSSAVGYCFGENTDHVPTTAIPDEKTRQEMADKGQELIEELVRRLDMPHVVEQLRKLEQYGLENEEKYPWMPSAYNKKREK